MSTTISKTTKQAGSFNRSDRKTIIPTADSPELASAEETQALPGCEAQESQVRELHAKWLGLRRNSLQVAFQLGRILAHLKAELKKASPKRRWEPYVREHLGIEPRTASNYMRIHREASSVASVGDLMKSETISEIGIREVLDILADLKTANGPRKSQQDASQDSKANKEGGCQKATGQPPLQLVDGSRINLERLQWSDGLVLRSLIESWLSEAAIDCADPNRVKIEARRQRIVIHLAAGINRACGSVKPSPRLIASSLDAFLMLVRESWVS